MSRTTFTERALELVPGAAVRYRCSLCGNLTRFDVVERRRTRSFYHFTIGGALRVEEEEILERDVEDVICRWCNTSRGVEAMDPSAVPDHRS